MRNRGRWVRERRQGRHPVNDWTVSSLRGNLVVNSVTGFGNFDNVDVRAFDSVKFDYTNCGNTNRRKIVREELRYYLKIIYIYISAEIKLIK